MSVASGNLATNLMSDTIKNQSNGINHNIVNNNTLHTAVLSQGIKIDNSYDNMFKSKTHSFTDILKGQMNNPLQKSSQDKIIDGKDGETQQTQCLSSKKTAVKEKKSIKSDISPNVVYPSFFIVETNKIKQTSIDDTHHANRGGNNKQSITQKAKVTEKNISNTDDFKPEKKLEIQNPAVVKESKEFKVGQQVSDKVVDKSAVDLIKKTSDAIADFQPSNPINVKKSNQSSTINLQQTETQQKSSLKEAAEELLANKDPQSPVTSGQFENKINTNPLLFKDIPLEQVGQSLQIHSENHSFQNPLDRAKSSVDFSADKSVSSFHGVLLKPAEQIISHIQSSSTGQAQQIQVTLNPAELGTIKISFRQKDDQVEGLLEIQRPEVRKDIEKALPQIAEAIAQSGINLRRLEIVPVQNTQHNQNQPMQQDLNLSDQHHLSGHTHHDMSGNGSIRTSTETPFTDEQGVIRDFGGRQYFDDKSVNMFA